MIRCTGMHNVRSAGVSFSSKLHGTTRIVKYCARRSVQTHSSAIDEITIARPDDWHLHVRDGPGLDSVVPLSAAQFGRAIIMPNLVPPVTNTAMALDYKTKILNAVPTQYSARFTPLMTLYLTDNTTPEEIYQAKEKGVVALKMYPAGATTNSDSGVTDWKKCIDAMKAMEEATSTWMLQGEFFPCLGGFVYDKMFPKPGNIPTIHEFFLSHVHDKSHAIVQVDMPLLVHGEVTDPSIDFFDREAVFIKRVLTPLLETMPNLRVVMEHITTKNAAEFVASAPANVAASITPQHILWNRNSLFVGGLRPHAFCLPILKRETHREAVAAAAMSGSKKFFLGTDSAPHPKGAKESACGCAGIFSAPVALPLYTHAFEMAGALSALESFTSFNGPDFYKLNRNTDTITLRKEAWTVPDSYEFGDDTVVPMWAGLECPWKIVAS